MKDFSGRKLTLAYCFALGLIAFLTIASHVTLNRVLATHDGSAAVVNLSGRQRMLSQRIASLAGQIRLGVPDARADLLHAADLFETAHHQLLAETTGNAAGRSAEAFRAAYFGGDNPLDSEVSAYLRLARKIAAEPAASPAIDGDLKALFAKARTTLLSRLDHVVQLHQEDSEAQLSRLQQLQRVTMFVVLAALAVEALLIFRPMVHRITRNARELRHLATTDPLTNTLNRREFFERGEIEVLRARRSGKPPAILMIDVDHFKRINDQFGHAGGDAALRALADGLRGSLRPGDLLGRMGGEEFAILLPHMSREGGTRLAERLRMAACGLSIVHDGRPVSFTISIGVVGDKQAGLSALLEEADAALYQAKQAGRNQVGVSPGLPSDVSGS